MCQKGHSQGSSGLRRKVFPRDPDLCISATLRQRRQGSGSFVFVMKKCPPVAGGEAPGFTRKCP